MIRRTYTAPTLSEALAATEADIQRLAAEGWLFVALSSEWSENGSAVSALFVKEVADDD